MNHPLLSTVKRNLIPKRGEEKPVLVLVGRENFQVTQVPNQTKKVSPNAPT